MSDGDNPKPQRKSLVQLSRDIRDITQNLLMPMVLILGAAGAVVSAVGDLHLTRTQLSVMAALVAIVAVTIAAFYSALSRRVFLKGESYSINLSRREDNIGLPGVPRSTPDASPPGGIKNYTKLASDARTLASSLYDRSGVYLITGVSLAVGGIGMFYFLRPSLNAGRSAVDLVVALLPASSMLLLVELIAFFFLRQSRTVMDEFRHFDHLARAREEILAALQIAADSGKPLDIGDLMNKGFYFSRSDRLAAGESTEIIETRKLEKTEIDLLNKVVELISARGKA